MWTLSRKAVVNNPNSSEDKERIALKEQIKDTDVWWTKCLLDFLLTYLHNNDNSAKNKTYVININDDKNSADKACIIRENQTCF